MQRLLRQPIQESLVPDARRGKKCCIHVNWCGGPTTVGQMFGFVIRGVPRGLHESANPALVWNGHQCNSTVGELTSTSTFSSHHPFALLPHKGPPKVRLQECACFTCFMARSLGHGPRRVFSMSICRRLFAIRPSSGDSRGAASRVADDYGEAPQTG